MEKKTAIYVQNASEARQVLEKLEEMGYNWHKDLLPKEYNPVDYLGRSCHIILNDPDSNLTWSFDDEGYSVISAEEFLSNASTPKQPTEGPLQMSSFEHSLLDKFAGLAMQGLLHRNERSLLYPSIAEQAYDIAEAMIAERSKRGK